MNNVWRLFRFDLGRLKANVMSIIITLGLVLVPSLFAWYNIIACWNVFDNTGNLTVAVANTDEGYQSDLIPLRINIGDQVVSALRANDQIDWHITDEEDAIDGAKSGALLRRRGDPEELQPRHAHLSTRATRAMPISSTTPTRSKSAIAPKITDQGADTVSYQVNAVFAQTLSEVSLSLAESLSSFADEDDFGTPHRGGGRSCARDGRCLRRRVRGAFALRLAGSLLRGSLAPFGRPGHPGLHGSGRDAVRRDGAGRRGAGHGGRSEELAIRSRARWPTAPPPSGRYPIPSTRCSMRPPATARGIATSARPGRCAASHATGVDARWPTAWKAPPVAAREPGLK